MAYPGSIKEKFSQFGFSEDLLKKFLHQANTHPSKKEKMASDLELTIKMLKELVMFSYAENCSLKDDQSKEVNCNDQTAKLYFTDPIRLAAITKSFFDACDNTLEFLKKELSLQPNAISSKIDSKIEILLAEINLDLFQPLHCNLKSPTKSSFLTPSEIKQDIADLIMAQHKNAKELIAGLIGTMRSKKISFFSCFLDKTPYKIAALEYLLENISKHALYPCSLRQAVYDTQIKYPLCKSFLAAEFKTLMEMTQEQEETRLTLHRTL
jgi:hypothetical protein